MNDGRKHKCDTAIKHINRNLSEMWYTHNRAIHNELTPKDEINYEKFKQNALEEIDKLYELVHTTQ